jgi:DNA (cytosine-5)-methyltransferase 1
MALRKNENKMTNLSFFSGAMGLDIGLERAGAETLLVCETNESCRQTIKLNRPDLPIIGDIRDYKAEEILSLAGLSKNDDIDLISGGPPCQAFSTAGARKSFEDERGNVFIKFIELICELKPKCALIENVRGLLSAPLSHRPHNQRGSGFPSLAWDERPDGALLFVVDMLKKSGYGVSFNLYNSANFGTPQVRERLIILCDRDGRKMPYLTPTHSNDRIWGLPPWKTFREAIKGIPDGQKDFVPFPEKRLRFYRMLKPGQYWRHLPKELQKEALGKSYYAGGGKTGFLRRLAWDKPSPTLVTHPAMPATDLAHPVEDRPLSVQEYKRLQEFPDDWVISSSLIEQYRQLGNAVPCGLGEAAGRTINNFLKGNKATAYPDFPYSRYKNTDEVSWEQKTKKRLARPTQLTLQFGSVC